MHWSGGSLMFTRVVADWFVRVCDLTAPRVRGTFLSLENRRCRTLSTLQNCSQFLRNWRPCCAIFRQCGSYLLNLQRCAGQRRGHRYERPVLALAPHIGAALGDEL